MTSNRRYTRRILLGATALAGALTLSATQASAQERQYIFDVPAQPLNAALQTFARQAQLQVIFAESETKNLRAPPLAGSYSADEALQVLLAGTQLKVSRTNKGVLQIAASPDPQGGSAAGGGADPYAVEALIVTAQKKEEAIQDVPIAISAFTQKSLDAQKIEGGFDLLKAIPNVTFSKSNFSGYNFSIRGIGTKAVSATTDPGVAVAFNNTTLIVNRLFEQEYFDVERVEVLRGPQGTLYGRNATSGVINVLSSRPRLGEFEGDIKLEGGNFNAKRVRGMVNVPIGDTLAVRFAGAMTQRDGYGTNEAASDPLATQDVREDVDGRDLWSARVTVGWEPVEAVRVNALWERFEEDDNRVRTSKQLCKRDPGVDDARFDTFRWADYPFQSRLVWERGGTSQGCLPVSLYADEAFGTPNGASLPYIAGMDQAIRWGTLLGDLAGGGINYGLGGNPYRSSPYNTNPLTPPCAAAAAEYYFTPVDQCAPDPYAGRTQSRDLRSIYSLIEPIYRAKADLLELSIDIDLTESLSFTSQTVYASDTVYASQDYNRYATYPIFNDSDLACGVLVEKFNFVNTPFPDCRPGHAEYAGGWYQGTHPDNPLYGAGSITAGGVFTDPQLGPSRSLVAQDLSQAESEQFNQEFRLVSNFDSDFNFSLGANFTRFETMNDYYVFINTLTLLTHFWPFNTNPANGGGRAFCDVPTCVYVDPNPLESINGEGHNYFRSANPYELTSSAIFGELYWQATDTVKVTAGARMTWDQKIFTPIPSQLLLSDYRDETQVPEGAGPEACTVPQCQQAGTGQNFGDGARSSPPNPDIVQEWREPTGRLIVDWKPDLGFTDESMFYASISHGYKGGGANPPNIAPPAGIFNARNSGGLRPATFEPEYINAYEVGTKNTLMGGALVVNSSAFYYDYEGYQVSKIVDRMALNENFDAKVWGLELEWIFNPTRSLRFNGTVGHLGTKIAKGEQSLDLMDRTQGGSQSFTTSSGRTFDEWMVIKPWVTTSSNCIAPVELVEAVLINNPAVWTSGATGPVNWGVYALCPFGNLAGNHFDRGIPSLGLPTGYDPLVDAPNAGQGFLADLSGNELPNAPHWTASLGAQYRLALPGGWDATLRGDFYWQSQSYARVYNTQYDKLRAWTNTNVSLWVENPDWGVTAEVYVKNVFDETPITDAFLNSDDSGLTTNVFTLDPRLVGVSIRKSF